MVTITGPATINALTAGPGVDRVVLSTLGGNDNINASGLVAPITVTVFAGDGNDTVIGSPQDDLVFGGFGNDILVGGAGNDTQHGEEGQDIFGNLDADTRTAWRTIRASISTSAARASITSCGSRATGPTSTTAARTAADIFRFFGNAAANTFELRQGGTPTHFNAFIGAVVIDNHGIEDIVISGQGGADTFIVQDLYATEVVTVNVDVGAADAAIDAVTVNGRNVADNIVLGYPAVGQSGATAGPALQRQRDQRRGDRHADRQRQRRRRRDQGGAGRPDAD